MPNLSGSIDSMTLPRLFLDIRSEKTTGIAVFERNSAVKKVFFRDGDAVFASSSLKSDRLGEYLLRTGMITQNQYAAVTEIVQKTGKMEDTVLVNLGFITQEQLIESLRRQVKDIILSLFTWKEGTFCFEEGPFPLAGIVPLGISSGNIILEGLSGFGWQAVRRSLPPLSTIIRPAADPAVLFQAAAFTHDQKSVLLLIDGQKNIEQICAASHIGDFNTLTAIHLFLVLGIAEIGEIKSEEERSLARQAVMHALGIEEAPVKEKTSTEIRQRVERAFDELSSKDHYQVLEVAESASLQEIRKAFFRLAKLYHPDRHFDPELADLKGALEALFARIREAYNILSNPESRKEYDLSRVRKAAKTEEEEENIDTRARAANQFNSGLKAFKEGNFWGASEAFRWASRLDPTNPRYFYYQGLAFSQMPRRARDAEACFKKAIELDPAKTAYYIELGNLYLRNNMKARATAVYKEALKWDPDSEQIKQAIRAVEGGESK